MATLYVENVPEEIYDAVRAQAQSKGKSIAAEVIALLTDHVPTPVELERRRKLFSFAQKARAAGAAAGASLKVITSEEMQREDRDR